MIWAAGPTFSSARSSGYYYCKNLPTLAKTKTGLYENIINGVKQGNRASTITAKGASCLSRAKMWGLLRDVVWSSVSSSSSSSMPSLSITSSSCSLPELLIGRSTYEEFKRDSGGLSAWIRAREKAIKCTKDVLGGWIPNTGDEIWGLDVLIDPKNKG